ncbi:MAG: ZIP family metal transporter [Patescibacteria group bacterium]
MDSTAYSLIAVALVSLVSLIGVFALSLGTKLSKLMPALVGLAAGALLGDAVIHLIPESLEIIGDEAVFGVSVLIGVVAFFLLEKYLRWHHAHHGQEEEHENHERFERGPHAPNAHIAPLVLVADGVHNMVDGAVIAASFLISPELGIATTIAVFLHEIPQEIADYALLIHSGLTRSRALFFNFLSGLTALIGASAVLILESSLESVSGYLIAFTAGAFIYLAAADLVPELHKTTTARGSVVQFVAVILGIALMLAMTALE